jgi:hypothetical protein
MSRESDIEAVRKALCHRDCPENQAGGACVDECSGVFPDRKLAEAAALYESAPDTAAAPDGSEVAAEISGEVAGGDVDVSETGSGDASE